MTIRCSQIHFGPIGITFTCRNPASVIITTHKHGYAMGLCTTCFHQRVANKDDDNFLERHSFREVD